MRNEDTIFFLKTTVGQPGYEFTHDFILPDMYPDVKKILYFTASFDNSGGYPENDGGGYKITYDGSVFVKILFCDEADKLNFLTYDLPYSFDVRLPECEGVMRSADKMQINSLGVKAVNPRKINVRVSLSPALCVFDEKEVAISSPIAEGRIEKLTESVSTMEMCNFCERDISFSEDMEIDKSMPVVEKVVYLDVLSQVTDSRSDGYRIFVKGYADVEMMYVSGGEPYFYTKRILVEKSIEAKGLDTGATVLAYMNVCKSAFSVVEDETGEARVVEVDFIARIGAICAMNVENSYVKDAYAVGRECVVTEGQIRYARLERPKTFAQNRRVVMNTAEAPVAFFTKVKRYEADQRTGVSVDVYAIVKKEVGGYGCEILNDSFFVDFPPTDDACLSHSEVLVCDKSIRSENGVVYLCFTVCGKALCYSSDTVKCVCTVEESDRECESDSAMILYYPKKDESDWEISKRFKVRLSDYLSDNPSGQSLGAVIIRRGDN